MDIKKVKIQNMLSSSGNEVPNQFEIFTDDGKYFQSYQSMIAFKSRKDGIFLDEDKWDYSRTTLKYLHSFLGTSSKKEIEKGIDSGLYKLVDLN